MASREARHFFIETKSKQDMRKFFKRLAASVCVSSVVLAGCETPDGGICLWWTLGFITLAVLSGLAYKRMEEQRNG